MPLSEQQFARRDGGATHLRKEALRVDWTFDELITNDSHVMRARFSCSAQIADTDADKRMFREVFLGSSPVVTVTDVAGHLQGTLRAAAAEFIAQHAVDEILSGKRAELEALLVIAANRVSFACGLEILPPLQLELSSPSLERSKLESVHRARAEERVASQVQHLQRAGELLKEFDELRSQMPELKPGEILAQINPVDRGSTLQSLLLASAKHQPHTDLWAVAGQQLLMIDPTRSPPATVSIGLPVDAGPLRSVQPATIRGRRMLLVGARLGVLLVPVDSPAESEIYFHPDLQSQLGFNRVVVRGDEIWGSHGESGIVGWKLGAPASPFARFQTLQSSTVPDAVAPPTPRGTMGSPSLLVTGAAGAARPAGPRNLQVLDADHLVWSVGNELFLLRRDSEPQALPAESTAEIVAVLPDETLMFVVHADSTIALLSRQTHQITDRQRRSGNVCAAGTLPWLGSVRLLLVDTAGPIDCVGFDDPLITQYVSNHRSLRIVTASAATVVAVSSDRQRVLLWHAWDGRSPAAEIHVTGLARHRVADVEFG